MEDMYDSFGCAGNDLEWTMEFEPVLPFPAIGKSIE